MARITLGKSPALRYFCFALPAVLAGCFAFLPKPVVRYHNTDPDPVFFRGVQSNTYRCGALEFTTSWEAFSWSRIRYRKGHVRPAYFRVEVRNLGAAPVLIAPDGFTLHGPPGEAPRQAIDPEKIILSIREDIEKLEARMASETADHGASGLRDPAGETASFAASPEEREKRLAENRKIRKAHQTAMREYSERARRLDADWQHWSDVALRKTTLGPGQRLGGTVAFDLDRPFPETLTLRYIHSAEGALHPSCDLGRYVPETDETAAAPKPAAAPRRPEP